MGWLALILGLLLASSAVTDLLWWLPYYAFTAEWEKCSGGFFTKRVCKPHTPWDRWLLFALCLCTGVFYTLSAIHSFGAFQYLRDEESERRMRRSFAGGCARGRRAWHEAQLGAALPLRLRHREMTCTSMVGTGGVEDRRRSVLRDWTPERSV